MFLWNDLIENVFSRIDTFIGSSTMFTGVHLIKTMFFASNVVTRILTCFVFEFGEFIRSRRMYVLPRRNSTLWHVEILFQPEIRDYTFLEVLSNWIFCFMTRVIHIFPYNIQILMYAKKKSSYLLYDNHHLDTQLSFSNWKIKYDRHTNLTHYFYINRFLP